MLEVLSKGICFLIMYMTGVYVVNKIVSTTPKIAKTSYVYIFLLAILTIFLHPIQYTPIYTITIFLLIILVYKKIFRLTIEQAIIACSIFMMILFISDIVVTTILRIFYSVEQIRMDHLVSIMTNLSIGIFSICIINTNFLYKNFKKFYNNLEKKKIIVNIIFLVLLIIGFSYLVYNFANNQIYNKTYTANMIIMVIFVIITYIFIESKNNYKQLSDEYDSLFSYVQNFEDWIEKEQLNRHEYKNQLAVLRCITKEKKVKSKIDEILEDNINIEGQVVHKLKEIPKGGLKGLMYYKAAIAQKRKVKLEVDVVLESKSILTKLSEEQIKTLCKLIGIYFDNAIEAAVETKQKTVLLEIYEIKDKVNIVISNSFKKNKNFEKRNERGITTKGEGHGNGLYFANNIVSKNVWINTSQEIIDNYYIQTLTIKN